MGIFWDKGYKKDGMVGKAQEADQLLNALGVEAHTESGKQIRAAIAMELLGTKYDLMDKHSKASFLKQNRDVLTDVRRMLQEEGVLSRPAIEDRRKTKWKQIKFGE